MKDTKFDSTFSTTNFIEDQNDGTDEIAAPSLAIMPVHDLSSMPCIYANAKERCYQTTKVNDK